MLPFYLQAGNYFVVATLLPLASFLLILLAFGVWGMLRPFRDKSWAAPLYELFGGDTPGQTPAIVATGAIGLAFLLSLGGFIMHATDHQTIHLQEERIAELQGKVPEALEKKQEARKAAEKAERDHENKLIEEKTKKEKVTEAGKADTIYSDLLQKVKTEEQKLEMLQTRWSGRLDWLKISPAGMNDPQKATLLQLGFYIDGLASVMFLMVTFIATLIHLFSIGYMSEELEQTVADHQVHTAHGHLHRRGRFGRFFLFLSLFCFSMLNLLLADNLFQVFVSWELVGICSYLLIGFYYERQSASNAANKAFITNRIGDAGFILGLLIVWTYIGTFNFQDIFSRVRAPLQDAHGKLDLGGQIVRGTFASGSDVAAGSRLTILGPEQSGGTEVVLFPRDQSGHFHGVKAEEATTVKDNPKPKEYGHMPYWLLVAAGLGIFLGCVGKSAQFPLQVWLPDAMEGPTPVSALIHAATMVAAGVYLVGRCYPLFTGDVLLVIAYTGGITLFVAATVAVVMTDIKKVLAYSTVSQLGYMMLALGVGGWIAGLFHLLTHACFKALLFLGSGSVIYGCHHEQDMGKMGGLYPKMKITALTMLVGVLAIAGIPLFTGWYSKDAIMAQAMGYVSVHPNHLLLFLLPLVTAGLTTFYMFRMWFLTFTGEPRDHHVHEHAHESPGLMTMPLVVLAVLSIMVAWGWPIWDAKASFLEKHLHHAQPTSVAADYGHVLEEGEVWEGGKVKNNDLNERLQAHSLHETAGALALGMVGLGILFAVLLYYKKVLDPSEALEQFPGIHRFLSAKWYFDEVYSAAVVRPALVVATWFRWFDLNAIDGLIHWLAHRTVQVSSWDGSFDRGFIDGLVNLVGNVTYAVGSGLRRVQTGYLRSYVLFLVLAAVGIFVVLSYFVAMASAGP